MGGTATWRREVGAVAVAGALAVSLWLVFAASAAHAVSSPTPWDGVNPFRCTIQDAGQGDTVPDPGADPYCVRFDKTNQNVTELGLIAFLTEEPARFSAAAPKCFYYQEDHWRGSVSQADQQTVIYEFYGHYFFNKATGDGGVWVTDFRIAGQTSDPRTLPGFPPQYDKDFGPGTGGFISHNDVPADPNCVAKANQAPGAIYSRAGSRCPHAHGGVRRSHVGPVRLGMTRRRVRAVLGPPRAVKRGFMRYCVASGGTLLIGNRAGRGRAQRGRAEMLLTTADAFRLDGRGGRRVTAGASLRRLRAAFPNAVQMLRVGQTAVYRVLAAAGHDDVRRPSGVVVAGVAHGHIRYLATYDAKAISTAKALRAYLRRAG